jgi:hypothetical protein
MVVMGLIERDRVERLTLSKQRDDVLVAPLEPSIVRS